MKNKRYIRLAKKMKSHCTGNCNGGKTTECKYYRNCFNGFLLFPKQDDLRYLQLRLKGKSTKR
ncbi:MAG: hypothetical protein ACI4P7_05910 [Bacilli bacterium]